MTSADNVVTLGRENEKEVKACVCVRETEVKHYLFLTQSPLENHESQASVYVCVLSARV